MFVLLEHTTSTGAHWDLLIEQPGHDTLLTWRLLADPLTNKSIPAEHIGRHRRIYLEFEGDIGGGRGVVRRIDRGPANLREIAGDTANVELSGDHLHGTFTITRTATGLHFCHALSG